MMFTDGSTARGIRELMPHESDEFVGLMEIAFRNSIEEDRLDTDELRKILEKIHTRVYKIIARIIGMRMEFYVAKVEDTIASGIQLNIDKNEVYVGNLMTHPEFRRQGLARELLRLSFKRALELGRTRVRLDARADNVNAVGLYTSEGFETTYHICRFDLDSVIDSDASSSKDLSIREVGKIAFGDIEPMLDDCIPASHLDVLGREKYVKDFIPSKAIRFFAKRLAGQSINTYAFYVMGDEKPRGFIQASQSRIEDRIRLSSPILKEEDNELLIEVIPKILEIESGYSGLTTATVNSSVHRVDTISRIESLGFRKVRESVSMTKRL
ncbi:MAG: GNAT family N-acetyltransferase [Candidatus Thorarchaeota archaeon]|nr:MAG: GNAT family N-acetyltransferase [Candidatus Thorarchaeota archaeon]